MGSDSSDGVHVFSPSTVEGILLTLAIGSGNASGGLKTIDASPVVADGWHNAFAALTAWNGRYWLAYRRGSGHTARDGVIVVSVSSDLLAWEEVALFQTGADDRDAQWVVFNGRLWLYFNSLRDGLFAIYASQTEDGKTWSEPERVYRDGFILWKPIERDGLLYAGAHRPGADAERGAELVCSSDGLAWSQISTLRAGRGESETTLSFAPNGDLTAFLRDQRQIGGAILESRPPYTEWAERSAGVHLSGHAAYTIEGVTYVFSRAFACDPPIESDAPRSALPAEIDQGTIVYTYEEGVLVPYCLLGPLHENHDASYATAIVRAGRMWAIFHRARHRYEGTFRYKDAADLLLAEVPLKK